MIEKIIDSRNSNQRIDKYVRKLLPNAPLSFIYKLFRKKDIKINKHWVDKSYIIQKDELISIYVTDEQLESFKKDEILCKTSTFLHEIIYEDENILIVNKPKGLLVHGDNKNKKTTLTNDVLNYLYSKGEYDPNNSFTPGPAHRIDRNTSGILIFGKKIEVLQDLMELFKEKNDLEKEYIALVVGRVEKDGIIKNKLLKDEEKNMVFVSSSKEAKEAITEYKILKNYSETSLLSVKILTGRTHQIRVHMNYIKHPIVGDNKYGDFKFNKEFFKKHCISSQFLHAKSIKFAKLDGILSYLSNKSFAAQLPKELNEVLKRLH